jgi:hypothetical protein
VVEVVCLMKTYLNEADELAALKKSLGILMSRVYIEQRMILFGCDTLILALVETVHAISQNAFMSLHFNDLI